ncbi:MAG: hypothetical protein R6X20_05625 [Phycisphaerae bacterium]
MTPTRTRTTGILPAALAAGLLAAGCGGVSYTHFRPAGDYDAAGTDWVAQRTYQVPPGTPAVTVRLAARGQTDTNDRGVEFATLHVRIGIENGGEKAITLKPADMRLLDDEGNAVTGADAYAGREPAGAITVAGGASATYELVFDLPPGTRLADLGSVRLKWPYVYDGDEHVVTTKFVRIEEVHYYRPSYYRPYYYDPWYHPYWYGPYPRHHFGYGYYHGW